MASPAWAIAALLLSRLPVSSRPETRKEYDWAAQAHFEGLLRGGASLEQMNAEARARG